MRRAEVIPNLDAGCTSKRNDYSSMANYERFLKGQLMGYINEISGLTGLAMSNKQNSREVAQNNEYRYYLDKLQLAENNVNATIQCLNKDMLQRNEYSSKLYTLQTEIEELRKEVEEKKQIVNEAKERSSMLDNPYSKTTWWETWFPLGRPIKKDNVPVLLSVSIFMLIFSLGVFLRYAGMELKLAPITESVNSILKNVNSRKYP